MSSLFGYTLSPALQFLMSLSFVIVLIIATLVIAKRFGLLPSAGARFGRGREMRLSISEVMTLDGRRKLVLVKRDGVEHLLLVGGGQDVVIEAGISRNTAQKSPKNSTVTSRTEPTLADDEGYKITAWSVPSAQGATPQVQIAPNTKAQKQEDAQFNPRLVLRKLEDEHTPAHTIPEVTPVEGAQISIDAGNMPSKLVTQKSNGILEAVEKARNAAIAAVTAAKTQSNATIASLTQAKTPAEKSPEVSKPEPKGLDVVAKIIQPEIAPVAPTSIESAPIAAPIATKPASMVNDDLEDQLRALVAAPIIKSIVDEDLDTTQDHTPSAPANANEPIELPTLNIELSPIAPKAEFIDEDAQNTPKSSVEHAFFAVFGTPETSQELEDLANSAGPAENRAYTELLDETEVKPKERPTKAKLKAELSTENVQHETYKTPQKAASINASFDELEQELAKLLAEPKNRA